MLFSKSVQCRQHGRLYRLLASADIYGGPMHPNQIYTAIQTETDWYKNITFPHPTYVHRRHTPYRQKEASTLRTYAFIHTQTHNKHAHKLHILGSWSFYEISPLFMVEKCLPDGLGSGNSGARGSYKFPPLSTLIGRSNRAHCVLLCNSQE